ncbi:MAG: tetratricopeptide repeat protein [Methylococcaceae bacterium]|nr:tetratricopeptide repeat protein [Methylococcaceae bacterium]
MLAEQSLHQGSPQEALARLQEQVKKDPSNPKLRVFLFQLLAVLGQWERAQTQLKVCAELDPANLLMAQMYREAILCEALRTDVFAGRRTPLVFGDPEQWVALLIEALRLDHEGSCTEARDLRGQALEQAPVTVGSVDQQPFGWIADADSRLGPVLEAVVNGRYYWVPFQRLARVEIEPPADLRDLVWMPAQLQWANGGSASGLIPTRYAGSEAATDPQILMSRRTDWRELVEGSYAGLGQRLLVTDQNEYPLMDVRSIDLTPAAG